jgi:hypothetical protein
MCFKLLLSCLVASCTILTICLFPTYSTSLTSEFCKISPPKCLKLHFRDSRFQNFPDGACPGRTPLDGLTPSAFASPPSPPSKKIIKKMKVWGSHGYIVNRVVILNRFKTFSRHWSNVNAWCDVRGIKWNLSQGRHLIVFPELSRLYNVIWKSFSLLYSDRIPYSSQSWAEIETASSINLSSFMNLRNVVGNIHNKLGNRALRSGLKSVNYH